MHKIVIADDHSLIRKAIASTISQRFDGIEITEKDDLESTITYAKENPDTDLILLNLNMPSMNGLNGIVSLRSAHFDIPALIISVEEDKNIMLQAVTYGATGFITKSMQREKVSDAIGKILDGQMRMPADIFRPADAPRTDTPREESNALNLELISSLTRRQLLVLKHLTQGDSNKLIGYNLNIAECTVKAHVSAIMRKLKVQSRLKAVLCASTINFDHYLH